MAALFALLAHVLIPRFVTYHYLVGTQDGKCVFLLMRGDPSRLPEPLQECVCVAKSLFIFGYPFRVSCKPYLKARSVL